MIPFMVELPARVKVGSVFMPQWVVVTIWPMAAGTMMLLMEEMILISFTAASRAVISLKSGHVRTRIRMAIPLLAVQVVISSSAWRARILFLAAVAQSMKKPNLLPDRAIGLMVVMAMIISLAAPRRMCCKVVKDRMKLKAAPAMT